MTLIEKFTNLTPEQREQFDAVKDATTLDAYASECGIDLTSEERQDILEYYKTGTLQLADDDLDVVAGGAAKDDSPTKAINEGRMHNLPSGNLLCACHNANKWASYDFVTSTVHLNFYCKRHEYKDIKCYKCEKTWDSWIWYTDHHK